jgi:hypothetical protein
VLTVKAKNVVFHLCEFNSEPRCSRDSSVGIVTRLRTGPFGVRIPVETRNFSHLQNVQTVSETLPASYSLGISIISRE